LEKLQKKVLKKAAPYIRTLKIHKMPPDCFLWWRLVPQEHLMLYFYCTIFAGLDMGTLVARQFLQTMKIFFQKKNQFARLWHELWHPKHPGTPGFIA